MYKIDGQYAVPSMPAMGDIGVSPNSYFKPNTPLDIDWLNAIMQELCNAVTGAGLALDKSLNNQLYTAIVAIVSATSTGESIDAIIEDTAPKLGNNLDLSTFKIVADTDGQIVFEQLGDMYLDINNIHINTSIGSIDDTATRIDFSDPDKLNIICGGNSIFDINDNGTRFGGANASINAFYDDDTMSANSANALCSAESAKQYMLSLPFKMNKEVFITGDFRAWYYHYADVTYGMGNKDTTNPDYTTAQSVSYQVKYNARITNITFGAAADLAGGVWGPSILLIYLVINGSTAGSGFFLGQIDSNYYTGYETSSLAVNVNAGDLICFKTERYFGPGGSPHTQSCQIFTSMLLSYI